VGLYPVAVELHLVDPAVAGGHVLRRDGIAGTGAEIQRSRAERHRP
jgi:hypothetical protein